jgi:hypothetical protein
MAALVAATITALVIFVSADGLLHLFPRWVADTSPANVPAADRLANNIAGDEDHWFSTLFLGALIAMVLSLAAWPNRRPWPSLDPVGNDGPA